MTTFAQTSPELFNKPLAVEEQFYVVWPLLIAWRWRAVALFVASLQRGYGAGVIITERCYCSSDVRRTH